MFSKMLIGNLSNTPNDDDYNMHSNLPIVWMGDNFDEVGKKKVMELKAIEVLVPHFNHVGSNVIA